MLAVIVPLDDRDAAVSGPVLTDALVNVDATLTVAAVTAPAVEKLAAVAEPEVEILPASTAPEVVTLLAVIVALVLTDGTASKRISKTYYAYHTGYQ